MSEQFCPELLQQIVDGIYTDGDEVFVECEVRIDFIDMEDAGNGAAYKIKLTNNHIKLFPVKQSIESYTKEDLQKAYAQGIADHCEHGFFKESGKQCFEKWYKNNY